MTAELTFRTDCGGIWHVTQGRPFVVDGWDFKSCTDPDPHRCACSHSGAMCATCREDIRDGQEVLVVMTWIDGDLTGEDSVSDLHHADCWAERGA